MMNNMNVCIDDDISTKLYTYLCNEVVGSDKVVKYRRLFFKVLDDIKTNAPQIKVASIQVSSGSKAEGMDLPGSDYDVMMVATNYFVYEKKDYRPDDHYETNECRLEDGTLIVGIVLKTRKSQFFNCSFYRYPLIMDTQHTPPGFAILTVPLDFPIMIPDSVTTDLGRVMSNKKFKEIHQTLIEQGFLLCQNRQVKYESTIHGPCISDKNGMVDCAFCFKCEKWPSVAWNWVIRSRSSGWPTDELISQIIHSGALFVPIGSKITTTETNEFEWRISFSIPERILVHSFTHTQFLCYVLLKIFLKEFINQEMGTDKVLCSYYMKTLVFWVSEEVPKTFWSPQNLIQCFKQCIKRLIYWVREDYIPNYFIPENNMIEGKLLDPIRQKLVTVLEHIYLRGWTCFAHCQSLLSFISVSNKFTVLCKDNKQDCLAKAFYPLSAYLRLFLNSTVTDIEKSSELTLSLIKQCVFQVVHRKKQKVIKELYAMCYTELNKYRTFLVDINLDTICGVKDNKTNYLQGKRLMHHKMISTFCDATSGWLLLAFYFYTCKRFSQTLRVLKHVLLTCSPEKLFIAEEEYVCQTEIHQFISHVKHKSFLRRIRSETIRNLNVFETRNNFCRKSDLLRHGPETEMVLSQYLTQGVNCPPVLFANYLKFLCYHHLGKRDEQRISLQELLFTVSDKYMIGNQKTIARALLFVCDALWTIGDAESAFEFAKLSMELHGVDYNKSEGNIVNSNIDRHKAQQYLHKMNIHHVRRPMNNP